MITVASHSLHLLATLTSLDEAQSPSTTILRSGHLPAPRLGALTEIERTIKTLARNHTVKERLCENIISEVQPSLI